MFSGFPRNRKAFSALAVGAVGAIALAGCSSGSSTPESGASGEAGAKATTITVWTWNTPAEAMSAAVPAFEAAHPGVTIDIQDVGNPAIWDKITTGMAAGGVGLADVFNIGIDYMGNYIETFPDGLANLRELGADELADKFPESVWKSGSAADGSVYGIPFEANTAALYYRADLFEQAGVDMSQVETWDELLDAGVKVKEATGADLFSLNKAAASNSADTWQMLTALQGGSYFDENGAITMNDAKGVRSLEILKKANDLGIVADTSGKENVAQLQIKGEVLVSTLPGSPFFASLMPTEAPDLAGKWSLRTPPPVEAGGSTSALTGATYLSVSNSSPNKEMAWEFVKFAMASEEGADLVYKAAGLFPAFEPIWDTPDFASPSEYLGGIEANKIFVDQLKEGGAGINFTSDYAKALKVYNDAQTQVILQGADPKEALDNAASLLAQQTGREIAD